MQLFLLVQSLLQGTGSTGKGMLRRQRYLHLHPGQVQPPPVSTPHRPSVGRTGRLDKRKHRFRYQVQKTITNGVPQLRSRCSVSLIDSLHYPSGAVL